MTPSIFPRAVCAVLAMAAALAACTPRESADFVYLQPTGAAPVHPLEFRVHWC
jgi:hypothetical protein